MRLGMAKIGWEDVFVIRELYKRGQTQRKLAAATGLGVMQIGRIVREECWQECNAPAGVKEEVERKFQEEWA